MRISVTTVFNASESDVQARTLSLLRELHQDYVHDDVEGRRHLTIVGVTDDQDALTRIIGELHRCSQH
jgi:hypothetical protein